MSQSSKPSPADEYTLLRFKGTPPEEAKEELHKLDEDLKKYSRDFFGYLYCGKGEQYDALYQFNLFHTSRLHSAAVRNVFGTHGVDVVEVLREARDQLKIHYDEEEREDYLAQLMDHLTASYKEGHVGVYAKDRKERLLKSNRTYWPGERYRITIELRSDCEEYKNCKSKPWVFAEGLGRNENRAALDAFRMLKVKEAKGLLWVNEAIKKKYEYPKTRHGVLLEEELNYFDEKDLRKMKKQMEEEGIQAPSCLKVEPETLVKRTDSSHSLKSLWGHTTSGSLSNPPLPSPIREIKRFLDDTFDSGSALSIFPKRGERTGDSSRTISRDTSGTTTPAKPSEHAEKEGSQIGRIKKAMSFNSDSKKTTGSEKSKGKKAQKTGDEAAAESSRNAGTAAKPVQKHKTAGQSGAQQASSPAPANKDAEKLKDTKTKEVGKNETHRERTKDGSVRK